MAPEKIGEYAIPMQQPDSMAPIPPDRIRLAHISDPHLTSLSNVNWRELLNKRAFGYLSWRWRRQYEHRREILSELTDDLINCNPDHIVITGDLTHVGTPHECSEASGWLHALGPPERITVIPGNHDCYAPAKPAETVNLWLPYLLGDTAAGEQPVSPVFPFLRRRGPAAIIGLSSAHPSSIFLATGSVGRSQLRTLDSLLEKTGRAQMFRVLLLHHPPTSTTVSWRRRLTDEKALGKLLERHGTELVLHGHVHRPVHLMLRNRRGAIPVFGVPSASARGRESTRRAGYNICEIAASSQGWTLKVQQRALSAPGRGLATVAEYEFEIPRLS